MRRSTFFLTFFIRGALFASFIVLSGPGCGLLGDTDQGDGGNIAPTVEDGVGGNGGDGPKGGDDEAVRSGGGAEARETTPSARSASDDNPSEAMDSGPRPLRLRFADFVPPAGIDPDLPARIERAATSGVASIHLVLRRADVPHPERWQRLQEVGIEPVLYLGEQSWLVRADTSIPLNALVAAVGEFGAQALTFLRPEHKASPRLLAGKSAGPAGLVRLVVSFTPDTSTEHAETRVREVHTSTLAPQEIGAGGWALETTVEGALALLELDEVYLIEEGPEAAEPLMDIARLNTGAESVQRINLSSTPPTYDGWSGKNVILANDEGLDPDHDDFWNHTSNGSRTTPRWLSGCTPPSNGHGTMTAAIMLGNGWQSQAKGGSAYKWRGIAPEAIFACSRTNADVANASYTQGWGPYNASSAATDAYVRGGQVAVGSAGNQGILAQYGIEKGYYSLYRNAKNEIVVANFDHAGFQWNGSSLGPTWDGRIKPDIAAPGSGTMFPRDLTTLPLDIDWITIGTRTWSFNGAAWQGGWGVAPWFGQQNLGPLTQLISGTISALRAPILPPPYPELWPNRPLLSTQTEPNGTTTLSISGAATDVVKIRYRLPAIPEWSNPKASFHWSTNINSYVLAEQPFDVIADGNWHNASINVGAASGWSGVSGISALVIKVHGPQMLAPSLGANGYGSAGGSSASSPVVAGAAALLLDQMRVRFGVQLGNHAAASPFFVSAPGLGAPLPSTFRALLTHTARDLAVTPALTGAANPDTGAQTLFHKGPDLASGYGMVDMAEAARLVDAEVVAIANGQRTIVERNLSGWSTDSYTIQVPAGSRLPLKVTLAWDDPPAAGVNVYVPKLVNDLDLRLKSPSGQYRYPWTIDAPYAPGPGQYPGDIEPEPIAAASIKPARQDIKNGKDNLEQVVVEFPEAGTWTVEVIPSSLAMAPQKYSLILWNPAAARPRSQRWESCLPLRSGDTAPALRADGGRRIARPGNPSGRERELWGASPCVVAEREFHRLRGHEEPHRWTGGRRHVRHARHH